MANTVKVRIAVAVGPDGIWSSCGWAGGTDDEMMDNAQDQMLMPGCYFIEADLPIPEIQTIQAKVSGAQNR